MATSQFKAEVDLALKAPDAKNVEKILNDITKMVEALPKSAKGAGSAVSELVNQITKIQTALKDTGSLNSVIKDVKTLGASLKSLGTLQKGLELFSNKDIQNINAGTSAIKRAAAAFDETNRKSQVSKGVFGLDETKIAGVNKALKSLETEFKAIQQTMSATGGTKIVDPLFQQGLAIQRNIKNLQNLRVELQRNADLEKYNSDVAKNGDNLKKQFYREQETRAKQQLASTKAQIAEEQKLKSLRDAQNDGRVLAKDLKDRFARTPTGQAAAVNQAGLGITSQARYADPAFVDLQANRQKMNDLQAETKLRLENLGLRSQDAGLSVAARAIQQQINLKLAEQRAEIVKNNGETAKSVQLAKELGILQAKLKIQKSTEAQENPILKQAADKNRIDSMLSRTQGEGGAALLKVQLALMANYAIIGAVSGSVRAAITNSIQLEAAFRNVQAVTATTSTEMRGLEDRIKTVAATSKFTAVEVADAALILGQAGLSAKEVGDALPSVVALATAAGTSLANAVDLTTSIVGVFDKQASDTADVANKVTQASNSSKISVEKLALAFQYVGNAAAQTGVTFEETTAALATMSNAGIKSGSTLGTGLRQFLTEVQKPSEDFLESLRRVGLSISDIDIRSNGLVGVITKLRSAGFVASDAIKAFDVRSAAAFNALIANPDQLQDQYNMLQNTQAAVKANEIQMQSFDSQSKRLATTLNNLLATGFQPIQTALTGIARGLSDGLGPLQQYDGAIKAITTSLIIFAGLAVTRHLAGIGLAFIGVRQEVIATAGAMTLGSTATLGYTAATATLGGVLSGAVAALRGYVAALTVSVAVAGPMATAVGVLTGALRGLWTVITGLSLTTVFGVALAAYAAYTMLFADSAETAAKKTDVLKAAVNDSKAAFDEKQKAVDSLTKKIDDLSYKQDNLQGNTKALDQVSRELNAQFGSLGLQIDSNNNSYSVMIGKLKAVRLEMASLADAKLAQQGIAERTLLNQNVSELKQSLGNGGTGTASPATRLQRFVDTQGVLKDQGITQSQKEAIKSAIETVSKAYKPDFLGNTDESKEKGAMQLAQVSKAMDIISQNLKTDDARKNFTDITSGIQSSISKSFEVLNQSMVVQGTKNLQISREQMSQFKSLEVFGNKNTFDEALPSNYDVQGRVKAKNPKLQANELDLFNTTKAEILTEVAKIEDIKKTLKDQLSSGAISSDVAQKALQDAEVREQEFISQGKRYYGTVQERLKTQTADEVAILRTQARDKQYSKLQRADFLRLAGDKEAQLASAGAFSPDERAESAAARKRELGQAKASVIENQPERGGANKDKLYKDAEKEASDSLKQQASVFASRAKGNKISATSAIDLDEVDNMLDAGIQNLLKEKSLKTEALLRDQNARIAPKNRTKSDIEFMAAEVTALGEEADEKISNFVQGATNIYKAVAKKGNRFGAKADKENAEATLKQLQSDAEDALFDASGPLARSKIAIASGTQAPNTTLEKIQELAITKTKIASIGRELEFYEEYISALQASLEQARQRVENNREDLKNATPENRTALLAKLGVNLDLQNSASNDLRSAQKGQNSLRGNLRDAQVTEATQNLSIPQEASWDNINAKIEQTFENYKQTVSSFDEVGMIGDGIKGTLEGLTGNFASLFTNIVSGSMSAGDAFKSFAASIIQSMLNIIAQALAMQAIKALMTAFGFADGGLIGGGTGKVLDAGVTVSSPVYAASGGALSGGTSGKDSIPVMGMPGEYMVKKTAVDALGVDFMHSINNTTASSVNASSASIPAKSNKAPEVHNTYIVTPDQKPSLGPNDVEVIMNEVLGRQNSSFKYQVKAVASGNA